MTKFYPPTLTIEKTIENNNTKIYEMKLFKEDKLLIIDEQNILVYHLSQEKFIIRYFLLNKLISSKTEIIGKDKLFVNILFNTYSTSFILYKFSEEQFNNIYSLIPLFEITKSPFQFNIIKPLFLLNKIILIESNLINIFGYNNNKLILMSKIRKRSYISWIDGFKFSKEIIGLFDGINKLVLFYNIKKGIVIQQNILYDNNKIVNSATILNLNDNDKILFGLNNAILLYSFKINKILQKIEDKYDINCLTLKSDKIFFINSYINSINLNLEKSKIIRISFYHYKLYEKKELSNIKEVNNNLIVYQEKVITNFKDKIIIFNYSIKRTLLTYIKSIYKAIIFTIIITLIFFILLISLYHCALSIFEFFLIILYFCRFSSYYKKFELDYANHLTELYYIWVKLMAIVAIIFKLFYYE